MDKKIELGIGVFVLLSLIGSTYLIPEGSDLYGCNNTDEMVVGMCFKLSKTNDAGIQTRCYYNEETPTRYKNCKTGWIELEIDELIGEPVELPDYVEIKPFEIEQDFNSKADAEIYIESLKDGIQHEIVVIQKTQEAYSDEINVYWNFRLFKTEQVNKDFCSMGYDEFNETITICTPKLITRKNIIHEDIHIVSKFPETITDNEIQTALMSQALILKQNWNLKIEVLI